MKLHDENNYSNKYWTSHNYLVMGKAYLEQKDYAKVIEHCLKCEPYFEEEQYFVEQEETYNTLYNAYKNAGKHKLALENLEKIFKLKKDKDPLETARQLQEYEYSKKTMADSLKQVERLLKIELAHQTALRESNTTKFIAIGIGGSILLLSIGLLSRLRIYAEV